AAQGESEACSPRRRGRTVPGRVERLKDVGQVLRLDTAAGVDHVDANGRPARSITGSGREGDRSATLARHGLAGVYQQVDQDMLELKRVDGSQEAFGYLATKGDAVLGRVATEGGKRLVDHRADLRLGRRPRGGSGRAG